MDIREKIYNLIEEQGGADYDQKKELGQELSEADSNMLVQDLDRFYQGWFDTQQIKEYTEERARLEHIQETCFEVACEALALQGDPLVIPYFLKYVPVDEYDGSTVSMEDYNVQHLLDCISDKGYYGEAYIPVLLKNIHELVPNKMVEADAFLYHMILDDLNYFESTHPLFTNLDLLKKEPFCLIVEYAVEKTLKEIEEDRPEELECAKKILDTPLKKVSYKDKPIIKIAYVRQEFLKLHAAD
jgi:hypothetical protein